LFSPPVSHVSRCVLRLLLSACLLPTTASADDSYGKAHFSGFGSFAFSRDDASGIGMARDTAQPVAEGTDSSLRSDSILGLQAGYRFSPSLEVVSQIVLRHRVDTKPRSLIEWAYVAWRPVENVDLRAGRVGLDAFLLSDYRSVGYAQPWIRPPREFYGRISMHSIDGIDAAWRFDAIGMHWTAKVQAGRSDTNLPLGGDDYYTLRARRFHDFTLHAERNDWLFKLGYAAFRLASEPDVGRLRTALGGIAAGHLGAISAEAAGLNADLWLDGAKVRYMSAGAAYDDGRWQIQGEVARVLADSKIVAAGTSAYLSVGYRVGSVTPYAVVAEFRPQHEARKAMNDWSGIGESGPAALNAALAAFNATRIDQRTLSLGMRWDFASRAAFKMQWDRSHVKSHGYGLWRVDHGVGRDRKRSIDVLSLALDFTF
jgi:hypothetical protein